MNKLPFPLRSLTSGAPAGAYAQHSADLNVNVYREIRTAQLAQTEQRVQTVYRAQTSACQTKVVRKVKKLWFTMEVHRVPLR